MEHEKRISGFRKVPWFLYLFAPTAAYMFLGVLVSTAGLLAVALSKGTLRSDVIMQAYMPLTMIFSLVTALLGFGVFVPWYYFACGRPSFRTKNRFFHPKYFILLALAAFVSQFAVALVVGVFQMFLPWAVDDYSKLVELAGLNEMRWDVFLYVVIAGPILEELIFRGLTFYIARKFISRVWVAILLQAAAFGIMHGNLLQGVYAGLVGVIFGLVYYHFRSMYASIWMHICFNFIGLVVLR